MAKEKLGIYGGSFSPIHEGHIKSALAFLEVMRLDKLLIVPTANPPHKTVDGATADQRFEMARLAFEKEAAYIDGRLEISDFEMKREGKSYTIYTLEHYCSDDREPYMLFGTDMFLSLHRWYRAEDIFRLCKIVLMRRENDVENDVPIEEKKREYRDRFGADIYEIKEPPTVISSTELRLRIRLGDESDNLIPPAVKEYIRKNNLYKNRNDN